MTIERGELTPLDERVMFEIPRGRDGNATLRVRFVRAKTPEGKEVAWHDIREYFRGEDGAWHPTKKGITIRGRELAGVAIALMRACAATIPQELHGAARQITDALSRAGQSQSERAARLPHEEYAAMRARRHPGAAP